MQEIHVVPAYGRDYRSKAEAVADWKGGKDFHMEPQGCYCSTRDFPAGTKIFIRYKKITQVVIHTQE